MAERPVFHAALGRHLVELRERRGLGQRQAGAIATQKKLQRVNYQVIHRLEKGKIHSPDPGVLRDLSTLYDVSYEDLARRFFSAIYGVAWEPSSDELSSDAERLRRWTAQNDGELEWLQAWRALRDEEQQLLLRQVKGLLGRPVQSSSHPPSRRTKGSKAG